jgi:Flp pilus assembly protein TadG
VISRVRAAARRDDGASAVEFALVLPLLVILVFGIIAFGIIFAQQLALGNAAREGARAGVVPQRTCGQILAQTQAVASTVAMTGTDVSVTVTRTGGATRCPTGTSYSAAQAAVVPCAGSASGDEIKVVTGFTSRLVIPLVFADPSFDLTGVGVFRCEFT